MTEFSPEGITHRRILKIAIPIVLSNATVPILGAVDTGVVGQLGEAAPIGAVGIGAIIITTLYWFFGFLRLSTSGQTAQARGKKDQNDVSILLIRSLAVGLAAGILLICIQIPVAKAAFLIAPVSPEVESLASDYIRIRIHSAPAAICLFGIVGWLIALERTKSVLVLQIVMNGINIVLDLVFVLWLDLGVRGVAVASLIAEFSGVALGLWLCRNAFSNRALLNRNRVFAIVELRRMAIFNFDILVRNLLIECAFVSFLFIAADFGDVTLAANQILLQFLHITAYALDGFAFSAEALVGLSIGARTRSELRRSVIYSSMWAGIGVLVLALMFAVFGPFLIDLMTTASDVQAETRKYLPWMVALPLIGAPSWMLDGIFVGAMRTRDMRNSMAISVVVYGLTLLVLLPAIANHGLWAALLAFFVARGITLGMRYPALEGVAA
ncbi:MAG: MATE family efflux transporter [Rhodobacteraceae bacterium]|nr:MATE family efflux transporter [Paracoccaceae bacterium]